MLYMYTYIYIYMYIHSYMYTYIKNQQSDLIWVITLNAGDISKNWIQETFNR